MVELIRQKELFMKIALIGINAKYIHPNLAIRLLKKNTSYNTDILEYTIKDSINKIIDDILLYDIIAFSCYIWNIEIIKEILTKIQNKNKTIILGGPEVSYNATYYIYNNLANYVIKNEGEEAFDLLLKYLDQKIKLDKIPNLYHKNGYTFDKLVDLENIKMAYDLLDDCNNKIMYIETSRGCPYKCGYCMASLDNKLRFFNIEEIKNQILLLKNKNAKTFKFLDRTFNANKKFIELIDFIIENYKEGESYQFEITGDLLKPEYIDYINEKAPKGLIRFEIGIQSTNIKTNKSVGRIQNNELLFSNIKKIQSANVIDLHLDLIAGLPYEDYKSFENTFNEVVALRPKELQLGFLKMLWGTRLAKESSKYGYICDNKAPYEVIENLFMSKDDIKEIHIAEEAFEVYYNSGLIKASTNIIFKYENNIFDFYHQLGDNLIKNKGLENIFIHIDNFLKNKPYYDEIHATLIYDYLNHFKIKPTAWWEERLSAGDKKSKLKLIHSNNLDKYNLLDLYKYSILVELKDVYILGIYKPNEKKIEILKK